MPKAPWSQKDRLNRRCNLSVDEAGSAKDLADECGNIGKSDSMCDLVSFCGHDLPDGHLELLLLAGQPLQELCEMTLVWGSTVLPSRPGRDRNARPFRTDSLCSLTSEPGYGCTEEALEQQNLVRHPCRPRSRSIFQEPLAISDQLRHAQRLVA